MPTTASRSTRGGSAVRTAMLALVGGVGLLVAPATARSDPVTSDSELAEMVANTIDRRIVPGYEALAAKAGDLARATAAWCATKAQAAPSEVLQAFRESVLALARIEMFRFGPAGRDSRLQRIALWPDPRGVVRRQTQRLLAKPDPGLWSSEAIAAQSAAVQGLPALELLLYPSAGSPGADQIEHRCRLAAAIAGNVAALAATITAEWTAPDGWRAAMVAPSASSLSYHSQQEAAADLVRALLTGLQIVREQEIMPWLKAVEASRTSAGLPFERSGLAKDYLVAGIQSLRELKVTLRLEEVAARVGAREPDKRWMQEWMASAVETLEGNAAVFAGPSAGAPETRPDIKPLRQAAFFSNGLRQIIGRELAPAAGLLIGFNELDGD